MLLEACRAMGHTLFYTGAVASAHTHYAQGIALYDPTQHRASASLYGDDAGVVCRIYAARALWCLGYPNQGLVRSQEALTLAQQMAHPFSLGYALSAAALFHQFRREMPAAQEYAESAISLATEQGFPHWMAVGTILHGWARAQQGQAQQGLSRYTRA
jgi:predicted ATPase